VQNQGQSKSHTSHLQMPECLFGCPGQEWLRGLLGPPVDLGPLSDSELWVLLAASTTNADSRNKTRQWELTLCNFIAAWILGRFWSSLTVLQGVYWESSMRWMSWSNARSPSTARCNLGLEESITAATIWFFWNRRSRIGKTKQSPGGMRTGDASSGSATRTLSQSRPCPVAAVAASRAAWGTAAARSCSGACTLPNHEQKPQLLWGKTDPAEAALR